MLEQTQAVRTSRVATSHAAANFSVPAACAEQCRLFSQWESNVAGAGSLGPVLKYPARKTIYSKGDPAHHCYRVVEGAVRLSRILMDGHRQVIDLVLPGETFGLETTAEYGTTAEAVGEVAVLRCPRACIAHQLATRNTAGSQMASMLSNGLSSAQDHVGMLSHQGATQRVALFLLHFCEKQQGRRMIELPVGRQDIADYLGLTIETTCRSLSEMRDRNVIGIHGRRSIEILDREGLEASAEGDV